MKRLEATVRGRVQGVYFRQSAADLARALALTGWVANRPDGSVQVVAEGEEARLKRLLDWLHKGPAMASVEGVDAWWGDAGDTFSSFTIRG